MILVDTSVWIRSARQRSPREALELDSLLAQDEVAVTEIVIAEVLQGSRAPADFDVLADKLDALHFLDATKETWRRAGQLSFQLARQGLPTPLADLAIAAVALEHDVALYAVDEHFQRVPGLRLHEIA